MLYPFRCECGKVYQFAAVQAGNRYTCPCGQPIVVPTLSQLRTAAGQEVLSPEVRLEQMLQLGMLPQQGTCVFCRAETSGVAHFWAICERPFVEKESPRVWWAVAVLGLLFGAFGHILMLARPRDFQAHGTEVSLRLPLRVCAECRPKLDRPGALSDAAWRVPVYADLLDKYPNAEVALDVPQRGVNLSAPVSDRENLH